MRQNVRVRVLLVLGLVLTPVCWAGPKYPLRVEVGLGYDSNPFLTPPDTYFDQFDEIVLDPDAISGAYFPIRIRGAVDPDRETGFALEYLLRGELYPEQATDNANQTFVRVEPGYRWRGGPRRRARVSVLPLIVYNREIFFDRDTGLANEGADSSDRFKYLALGANVRASWSPRRWELAAEVGVENRDYEDTPGATPLDHLRLRFRLDGEVDLAKRVKFYADYELTTREYSELGARNLNGDVLSANPDLEYRYHDVRTSLRVQPHDIWTLFFDAGYLERDDQFVGYNSYGQWTLRIRSIHRWGPWRLRIAPRYYDREWDRAFIFDNPTNPADDAPNPLKRYENWQLDGEIRRDIGDDLNLYGEIRLRDRDSVDPRFGYERARVSAGVIWER